MPGITVPPAPRGSAPTAPASPRPGSPTPASAGTAGGSPGTTGLSPGGPTVPASAPTEHRTSTAPSSSSSYYFLDGTVTSRPTAPPIRIGPSLEPSVSAPPTVGTPTRPSASSTYYFLPQDVPASAAAPPHGPSGLDVEAIRADFPILSERVNGQPLAWLDNAATTQKPNQVIDRLTHFYRHENSNIHRAAHELAARATDAYEGARSTIADFLGAECPEQIIFVRGATEAINLVAQAWGPANIGPGDEIVISHLEHHANIVPWQELIKRTGGVLRVAPVDDRGQLLFDDYLALLNERTKLVAMTQVSNALGTVTPIPAVIAAAHAVGAKVLVDGAQSVPHLRVNLTALQADFFVFSGHKIFGPTGIGVLYGRREVLEEMPVWQAGGNMIADVTLERSVFQGLPNKFEAGTGNIADAVGLAAALDYVSAIGLDRIAAYEHELLEYATPRLGAIPGVRLVGTAPEKASVLSFVLAGYEPLEVGRALNKEGIAVRAGHHCAQPILRRLGLEATVRPSVAFYNTAEEIDRLVDVVRRLAEHRPVR